MGAAAPTARPAHALDVTEHATDDDLTRMIVMTMNYLIEIEQGSKKPV